MKRLAILILLLSNHQAFPQRGSADFNHIDWKVQTIDVAAPVVLAERLAGPFNSDIEKVRAIFRWITNNISYNGKVTPNRWSTSFGREPIELIDSALVLKPLNERVAEKVLMKKAAVCDGYSRLFKILCDYAGIKSEIITGYAKCRFDGVVTKFRSNHSWNAVFIDNNWYLLDVTWASGFLTHTDEFIRRYDNYYFLTPPEEFIQEHYPDNLQWALLSNPPAIGEFNRTPFKLKSFIKYKIPSFRPTKGIIEAFEGETIQLELEPLNAERDQNIASDSLYESIMLNPSPTWAFVKPFQIGKKVSYSYTVEPGVEWLHIIYNDDVILRYKLNIKRKY